MEDNTKIKTTQTSVYQQPLENNRKIKTALTTNNQQKTTQKKTKKTHKYLPIAIRKQQKNINSTNNL